MQIRQEVPGKRLASGCAQAREREPAVRDTPAGFGAAELIAVVTDRGGCAGLDRLVRAAGRRVMDARD